MDRSSNASVWRAAVESRTSAGFRTAVRQLLDEFRIQRTHRRALRRSAHFAKQTDLRLNVGCGNNRKPGWVNIDSSGGDVDLQLDMREPLPFRDETAVFVYNEHFFEHLEYPDEAMQFLRESFRVLKPGGGFSVVLPDAARPVTAYVTGDEEYFRHARGLWHPMWCDTWMHQVNYHFRQGREHKYAYDFETLARIMADVGFTDIVRRDYDPALDAESRRTGGLRVNARKPEANNSPA